MSLLRNMGFKKKQDACCVLWAILQNMLKKKSHHKAVSLWETLRESEARSTLTSVQLQSPSTFLYLLIISL